MTPRTAPSKENVVPPPHYALREVVLKARPAVTRKPVPVFIPSPVKKTPKSPSRVQARHGRPFGDATSRLNNVPSTVSTPTSPTSPVGRVVKAQQQDSAKKFGSGSYDRVKAFERLKQLERSRFLMEDDDDLYAESDANEEGESKHVETGLEELEKEDEVQEIILAPKPSTGLLTSPSIGNMSSSTKVDSWHIPSRTFDRPKTASSSVSSQLRPISVATKKTSRLFGSRQTRQSPPKHTASHSEDLNRSGSGEDLGASFFSRLSMSHSTSFREDVSKSVSVVRKAFKAIVTGKSVVRRQSKVTV